MARADIGDLARAALDDRDTRQKTQTREAGSRAWVKREPALATAVLELLEEPRRKSTLTSLRALHAGELRVLAEDIAHVRAELRTVRFERDRMRLAYLASYTLAVKIAAECADPERIEPGITAELRALCPEGE